MPVFSVADADSSDSSEGGAGAVTPKKKAKRASTAKPRSAAGGASGGRKSKTPNKIRLVSPPPPAWTPLDPVTRIIPALLRAVVPAATHAHPPPLAALLLPRSPTQDVDADAPELYIAMMSNDSTGALADWTERYEEEQYAATAEMISVFVRASGCSEPVTEPMLADIEEACNTLVENFGEESDGYPLVRRLRHGPLVTHLSRISHVFLSPVPSRARMCSTWCPCLSDADERLQFDAMPDSPLS